MRPGSRDIVEGMGVPVSASRRLEAEPLTPDSFASRFEAESRRLWCVAFSIVGDRSRAADLVQESAVIALGKLQEFEPGTSFSAWMAQIVRFCSLNESRRTARRRTSASDPVVMDSSHEGAPPTEASPVLRDGTLSEDQHAFDDRVAKALASLEERARACLLLRTVLELSYKEIAETLGLPEGTAMSHVHRARRAMRAELAERDDL